MCTPAEVSGAARTSPAIPNRLPAPIVTMRTTSGLRLSVAPKTNGWRTFWKAPLARKMMSPRISASEKPSVPSAMAKAKMPAVQAPMNGTYAVTNVTIAIVPASGTPRMRAPMPTMTPLKAAMIVTPVK